MVHVVVEQSPQRPPVLDHPPVPSALAAVHVVVKEAPQRPPVLERLHVVRVHVARARELDQVDVLRRRLRQAVELVHLLRRDHLVLRPAARDKQK